MKDLLKPFLALCGSTDASAEAMAVLGQLPKALPQDWCLLAAALLPWLRRQHSRQQRPLLLGVGGGQGSGKSTLARALVAMGSSLGLKTASLSLDDVYHTRAARQQLARDVHPLLVTRGVPGTHDLVLLRSVLEALAGARTLRLPRFDKGLDDRCASQDWQDTGAPLDLLVLEGWCLGVTAQSRAALQQPVNALEREEDRSGRYRAYVNDCIRSDYEPLWQTLDAWLFLQVPSFAAVLRWRTEQEQQRPPSQRMNAAELQRFVSHYERLTDHLLITAPAQATWTLKLNEQHRVTFREESATATQALPAGRGNQGSVA